MYIDEGTNKLFKNQKYVNFQWRMNNENLLNKTFRIQQTTIMTILSDVNPKEFQIITDKVKLGTSLQVLQLNWMRIVQFFFYYGDDN